MYGSCVVWAPWRVSSNVLFYGSPGTEGPMACDVVIFFFMKVTFKTLTSLSSVQPLPPPPAYAVVIFLT